MSRCRPGLITDTENVHALNYVDTATELNPPRAQTIMTFDVDTPNLKRLVPGFHEQGTFDSWRLVGNAVHVGLFSRTTENETDRSALLSCSKGVSISRGRLNSESTVSAKLATEADRSAVKFSTKLTRVDLGNVWQ